ncbi:MAG TPA: hypothetical protein VG754_11555 [Verrucomicrobiae bacterium]|jgi:hypothetical protein|nr:hypothetical protein [Verrucomicrobiae bacterium]
MNAAGATICSILVLVVLIAPRRWALLGMIAGALFLTERQQVSVGGINFYSIRFLELAGFVRVMSRAEFSFRSCNRIDRALIFLYVYTAVVFCLRSAEGQAYIIGNSVDAFLCYFTFRGLVRDASELKLFLRDFIMLLLPYAAMILYESMTHRNAFAFIDGGMYNWVRGNRFRSVGTFRNPDTLGTLGAVFAPLYFAIAFAQRERKLPIFGMLLCLCIVWGSNSGGPLCATAVSFVAWGFWRMRTRMQTVRRTMAAILILLACVMKAPIWFLLARASSVAGGDGWHRAQLISVAFKHLNLWWFAGMPLSDTSEWFEYSIGGAADITNTFLSFGLNAGMGAIIVLVLLLVRTFSGLGKALNSVRSNGQEDDYREAMLWGLGAALMAHIANWQGIVYFDQSYMVWFLQLAAMTSVSSACIEADEAETVRVSPVEEVHASRGEEVRI